MPEHVSGHPGRVMFDGRLFRAAGRIVPMTVCPLTIRRRGPVGLDSACSDRRSIIDAQGCRGRDSESAELGRLLDSARAGRGSALVLWGAPGIGKSTLMRAAACRASDFHVLGCHGASQDSSVPYAALHELIWPLAARIPRLPAGAAAALRGLLRLGPPAGDRLTVCTAVLALLGDLAAEQPVLILADDAHRFDAATSACLAFVARRASETGLVLLVGTRSDPVGGGLQALPSHHILGLGEADARALIASRNPSLSASATQRLLDMAEGNPLALSETATLDDRAQPARRSSAYTGAPWCDPLPRTAANSGNSPGPQGITGSRSVAGVRGVDDVSGGVFGVADHAGVARSTVWPSVFRASERCGDPYPVGPRLCAAFAETIGDLGDEARTVVLLAAAAGDGQVSVVRSAATAAGVTDRGWLEALESNLVVVADGRIRLFGAMIRGVVYASAKPAQRRAAHAALADVLAEGDEPELRYRQLAAAAPGPDEELARELTDAAATAACGERRLAAADLLHRAAMLSPDAAGAAVRLARAARAAWTGGDIDAARDFLTRAECAGDSAVVARESAGLAGLLAFGNGEMDCANEKLALDMVSVDPGAEAELRVSVQRIAWVAGHRWDPGTAFTDSAAEPWQLPPGTLAISAGLATPALECYRQAAKAARERAELPWQALMLAQSATVRLALGQCEDAVAEATEALFIAEPHGFTNSTVLSLNTLALHAAMRGDQDGTVRLCERSLELSRPRRMPVLIAGAHLALGLVALGAGEPDIALARLTPLLDPHDEMCHPTLAALAAPDAIEAAIRLGRPSVAAQFLTVLADRVADSGAPWAVAALACGRALLGDDATAATEFERALTAAEASEQPFQRARVRLLYGEWLRRTRRRAAAREQLDAAATAFDRLGAHPWAARARQESDLVDTRSYLQPGTGDCEILTPQELRVARLAATGATNRDIAARLYISPRTVGHHLSRVFGKLGLTCRAELARTPELGSPPDAETRPRTPDDGDDDRPAPPLD
ncbi:AAA family ATPase [Nocardia sp. NPDC058058]|uniref:helix-turn-helix transcriptional regulator n=1 Tax=Nocardia sp. NPDC058058 TaxID=3346317 RepID=UPI0036DEEE9B